MGGGLERLNPKRRKFGESKKLITNCLLQKNRVKNNRIIFLFLFFLFYKMGESRFVCYWGQLSKEKRISTIGDNNKNHEHNTLEWARGWNSVPKGMNSQ